MDDSPLSITSSIAGILTFVVAIFVSIHARIKTIKESTELITTLQSVLGTITNTKEIYLNFSSTYSGGGSESRQLHEVWRELYHKEVQILPHFLKILCPEHEAANPSTVLCGSEDPVQAERIIRDAFALMMQHPKQRGRCCTWSIFERLGCFIDASSGNAVYVWALIRLVLSTGITPRSMRWYRERELVLKMMQERETIRSRFAFYQTLNANLSVLVVISRYLVIRLIFI